MFSTFFKGFCISKKTYDQKVKDRSPFSKREAVAQHARMLICNLLLLGASTIHLQCSPFRGLFPGKVVYLPEPTGLL